MNDLLFLVQVADVPFPGAEPTPDSPAFVVGPFDTEDAAEAWADARVHTCQVWRSWCGPAEGVQVLRDLLSTEGVALIDPLD